MARRQAAQLDLDFPGAAEAHAAALEPVRGRRAVAEEEPVRPRLRLWAVVTALLLVLLAAGVLFYQLDEFLASNPRFTLAAAAEGGSGTGLRLEGVVYAARDRLEGVFAHDFGRSVYLMPLEPRRRSLLGVDWVREARIARRWPSGVLVRIVERTPVAFVVLPAAGEGPARTALIDAEGVILAPPPQARFALPVLLGVSAEQPAEARRERVRLLLRLIGEAGAAANQISEVDAGDPENLKVTLVLEGRVVRLLLGDRNLRGRFEHFLSRYGEIQRHVPQATTFDLRIEGRMTAAEGAERGR